MSSDLSRWRDGGVEEMKSLQTHAVLQPAVVCALNVSPHQHFSCVYSLPVLAQCT